MIRLAVLAVCSLGLISQTQAAFASEYSYELDPASCISARVPDGEDGQPDARWLAYAKFIQSCPVIGPTHEIVFSVVTVRADLMQKIPNLPVAPDPVLPQIVDSKGEFLGNLSATFPLDEPAILHVTFTDWQGGFPQAIIEHETANNFGPDSSGEDVILRWNAKDRYFSGQSSQ